ncbi:MAG TPA: transketolase C-terminal domain-containing protein, partial [Acidimicrobiales bacterium]|nr:transketolase C-terminal domain-containing protein [Acidimicrobiales bacterium]
APSSAAEVEAMLATALTLEGPSVIRFPKTAPPDPGTASCGSGMSARLVRRGDGRTVCIVAVGKMAGPATEAAQLLAGDGIDATVWDPRVVSDPDPTMLDEMARHDLVVTVEDGMRHGGAGAFILDAMHQRRTATVSTSTAPATLVLGLPRGYLAQGRPDEILASLGLDGPGIARVTTAALAQTGAGMLLTHPARLAVPDSMD